MQSRSHTPSVIMYFHKSSATPPHYKWKIQLGEYSSPGKSLFHRIRVAPSLPRDIGHTNRHLSRFCVRNERIAGTTAAAAGGSRGGSRCSDSRGGILLYRRIHCCAWLPGLGDRTDRWRRRLCLRHRLPGLRRRGRLGGGRQETVITGVTLMAMFTSAIRIHAGRGRNLWPAEAATPLVGVWIHR